MNILAIEMSTDLGSIAFLHDGCLAGHRNWAGDGRSRQQLFLHLEALLREVDIPIAHLNQIVVGRGPGNFSGLRSSMAAAQAMALPEDIPLAAFSSGRGMASSVFAQHADVSRVRVIGDARRGFLWHALFERPAAGTAVSFSPWELATAENLISMKSSDERCLSSEVERLQQHYPDVVTHLQPASRYPDAADLAQLAALCRATGLSPEPWEPMYMHPPVA